MIEAHDVGSLGLHCTCDGAPHRLVCARVLGAGDIMTLAQARIAYLAAVSYRLCNEATYAAAIRAHAGDSTADAWHVLGYAADTVRRAAVAEAAAARDYARAYAEACQREVGR